MPGASRKKEISGTQAQPHLAEERNRLLTLSLQANMEPQHKAGEKLTLDFEGRLLEG